MEIHEEGSFLGIRKFNPEYKRKYEGSGVIGLRIASMVFDIMVKLYIILFVICLFTTFSLIDSYGDDIYIAIGTGVASLINIPVTMLLIAALNAFATIAESAFLNKKKLEYQ